MRTETGGNGVRTVRDWRFEPLVSTLAPPAQLQHRPSAPKNPPPPVPRQWTTLRPHGSQTHSPSIILLWRLIVALPKQLPIRHHMTPQLSSSTHLSQTFQTRIYIQMDSHLLSWRQTLTGFLIQGISSPQPMAAAHLASPMRCNIQPNSNLPESET